jgi:hypothetical protein
MDHVFVCDLVVSYDRIGDVHSAQGDLSSALSSYKKALKIEEQLGARNPANTDWQRDLSVSYNKIGDMPGQRPVSPAGP